MVIPEKSSAVPLIYLNSFAVPIEMVLLTIAGIPNVVGITPFTVRHQSSKPFFSSNDERFATVATLPCVVPFIDCFEDGKCGNDILIILGSGESYKTIESVLTIVKDAVDSGFARKDLFVGIGGGVICDLTGFAASLFKRGAKVQFVPTTLLAMVDASIGGKTGCDFENYKNMIGSFFPAQQIHIYPEFVQSLSKEQYRSGLAEALKTALLYDSDLYQIIKTEKTKILNRDSKIIDTIIQKCAKAKANVVQEDFTEKNIRMYLNLGHTFGHALETIIGLGKIAHGDAVAWGIGRVLELCAKKEICKESYKAEVFEVLQSYGLCKNGKYTCS